MQEKDKKKTINSIDYLSESPKDTESISIKIAEGFKPNDIICLKGDLGVGKTYVAKCIGKIFGVNENITSPTFNIVKSYNTNDKTIKRIHHFDLYRIKNISELINIDFESYLYDDNSIILIEWPEIAIDYIERKYKLITIKKSVSNKQVLNNNVREIIYEEC